jgi:hypothetical protein
MDWDNRPGVSVPEEMREILARNPGFIKTVDGGQRIADLYVQGPSVRLDTHFEPSR